MPYHQTYVNTPLVYTFVAYITLQCTESKQRGRFINMVFNLDNLKLDQADRICVTVAYGVCNRFGAS